MGPQLLNDFIAEDGRKRLLIELQFILYVFFKALICYYEKTMVNNELCPSSNLTELLINLKQFGPDFLV